VNSCEQPERSINAGSNRHVRSEVTRVAREVGTRAGGGAGEVRGVGGLEGFDRHVKHDGWT